MKRAMHVWVIGLILLSAAGCVSQVRYDRVVEQLNAIRKELNVAKAEALAFTQEATRLESLKKDARADLMAASVALQQAREEAEAERRTEEGQFVTLQRAIGQLNVQLLTLKDKLAEAKSDTTALKELVAAYQRKVRAEYEAGEPAPPPQHALEAAPVSASLAALPQAGTAPDSTSAHPPQNEQAAEPPEESLLSPIMAWLLFLWQSVVSLWRGIFS